VNITRYGVRHKKSGEIYQTGYRDRKTAEENADKRYYEVIKLDIRIVEDEEPLDRRDKE